MRGARTPSTWVGVLCIRCRGLARGRGGSDGPCRRLGEPGRRHEFPNYSSPVSVAFRNRAEARSRVPLHPRVRRRAAGLCGELRSGGAEASELRVLGSSRASPKPRSGRVEPFRVVLANRCRRSGSGRSGRRSEGRLTRCTTEVGNPRKTHSGASDDASHGVRFLSAFGAWVIVMPAYLTGTIRPQGFSPSRRFDPTRALWLCFTPHPPLGFQPSELSPLSQP